MPAPNWGDRLSPIIVLSNNWISRIGVVLVSAAGVFWLFLLPTYLQGEAGSAYMGILLFLLLPTAFFAGLVLIPIGIFLQKKKLTPMVEAAVSFPVLSWANPAFRRLLTFVALTTMTNILIAANLTYRAVEHMDSVQFCGATCHVVMKPEYVAYQNSPHSKVECVKCHIGPGASWFVQSKLSGVGQVVAVALNNYERPIPAPVENLRPARETCEGCHWPDRYGGDRLRVFTHYNDKGEAAKSVLLLHIGGGGYSGKGIHTAHVGSGIRIRYGHTDRARQNIPWVEHSRDGQLTEYFAEKTKKEDAAKLSIREMDCIDCHNRPSHTMMPPERALDTMMANGSIAAGIPEIRKVALDVLKKEYGSTERGEAEIPKAIEAYYKGSKAEFFEKRRADITKAARNVLAIWQRNVFPEMKVTWGTYVNNIGHTDYPGCFRCHDDAHKTQDGAKSITQDCNTCHGLLAMEESDPKILKDLGLVE